LSEADALFDLELTDSGAASRLYVG